LQKYPDYEIVIIFQPHTYSRTIELLPEFMAALSNPVIKNLFIMDIFGSARESGITFTSESLITKMGTGQLFNEVDFKVVINKLRPTSNLIICMLGAGDIDSKIKPQIVNLLQKG